MSLIAKRYTSTKPGSVSANLKRLREDAKLQRKQLGEDSGFPLSTIEKMEIVYEPPTNHPFLAPIAKTLAKKLGRSEDSVLTELVKGGAPTDFTKSQLSRIYQHHHNLAPQGFFSNKSPSNGKVVKSTKPTTPGRNTKLQSLITFLSTDPRVKTLAQKMELPLPRATESPSGRKLGQSGFSVRARAIKLVERLKTEGIDIKATMNGDATTAPSNTAQRHGHRGLGDLRKIVYAAVTTFNQRRMLGERSMSMPMDDFEIMMGDYLKLSGIDRSVLISRDIMKLIPKG